MSEARKAVTNLFCSLHHLILREKVQIGGQVDVVVLCTDCRKPVTGAAYKCLICNFHLHVSCAEKSHSQGGRSWHCLVFKEELENAGERKFLCTGCREPVRHSAYRCSVSECNFLLDKSCSEASLQIQRHPMHPNHTLSLSLRLGRCDCCVRLLPDEEYMYSCDGCDFKLCIKCASLWRTDVDTCGQSKLHKFFLISKKMQFNCDVCREERENNAYLCTRCRILVDYKCAKRSVPEPPDEVLTRPLWEVIYPTLGCLFQMKRRNVVERELSYGINRFSHQHDLLLKDEKLKEDKVCEGCMQLITSAHEGFYCCIQCNCFLHMVCAEQKKEIDSPFHDHVLRFLPQAPYLGGAFTCNVCDQYRHGFVYRCDVCDYNLDVHCSFLKRSIRHPGHSRHSYLNLAPVVDRRCNACDHNIVGYGYACSRCKFAMCIKCASLPFVVAHRYDTHHLTLTYKAEDDSGEYYCQICEEERDPKTWFYYCKECDFAAHPLCVLGNYPYLKFGKTYTHETHQHPITFVQTTQYSPPCDHCNKCFDGVALECRECNLKLHPPHKPGLTGCSQMLREDKKQSPDNLRLLMLRKDKKVMRDPSE